MRPRRISWIPQRGYYILPHVVIRDVQQGNQIVANAVVELAKVDAYMRAGYEGTYLDQNQKRFLLETTVRKIALSAK